MGENSPKRKRVSCGKYNNYDGGLVNGFFRVAMQSYFCFTITWY